MFLSFSYFFPGLINPMNHKACAHVSFNKKRRQLLCSLCSVFSSKFSRFVLACWPCLLHSESDGGVCEVRERRRTRATVNERRYIYIYIFLRLQVISRVIKKKENQPPTTAHASTVFVGPHALFQRLLVRTFLFPSVFN